MALKGLYTRLKDIHSYLGEIVEGNLPPNHDILYKLQDIYNLLPSLGQENMNKAFTEVTNDMLLSVYLSSMIRCVIALHNLINNKLANKEHEKNADATETLITSPASGS